MRTEPHGPVVVVHAPDGELDLAVAPELRARLADAHRPGGHLVLDLEGVTFVDSSALAVVVAADRRLRATGGVLRLAHASAEVRRVLRICGLADLLLRAPGALRRGADRAAHLVH